MFHSTVRIICPCRKRQARIRGSPYLSSRVLGRAIHSQILHLRSSLSLEPVRIASSIMKHMKIKLRLLLSNLYSYVDFCSNPHYPREYHLDLLALDSSCVAVTFKLLAGRKIQRHSKVSWYLRGSCYSTADRAKQVWKDTDLGIAPTSIVAQRDSSHRDSF